MRIASFVLVLTAFAVGQPITSSSSLSGLESRGTGSTASELETGPCKPYTLIFARATTEAGNMVLMSPAILLLRGAPHRSVFVDFGPNLG